MIAIFAGLLVAVLILIACLLPSIFQRYFLEERRANLQNTYQIISDALENEDFRKSEEAYRVLKTAAEASNTSIWVVVPIDSTHCLISVFGETENENSNIDFNTFTEQEKQLVEEVLDGGTVDNEINVFPSAFRGRTISIGYPQTYIEQISTSFGTASVNVTKSGAVFIHISLNDISMMAHMMQKIVIIVMIIIVLIAVIMGSIMANNILTPVSLMKNAAEQISKGDFSQEVPVTSNDEIGELSRSFNTMSKELANVDSLQSDFIANISHDFRSPLTSVKGYVEAMLDGTIPPEEYTKYLGIVRDETNRLIKMTNNVLDLTKMENGKIELHLSTFDVNEMIVKLALSLEQRVEEKKIAMNFQFLQDKLYVKADLELIQRVVYNLLDNALKFTPESGTITVETSVVGGKAMVSVQDTGVGISEEYLPHIFERFNKGDKSRGTNKMGAGLGLAIVKQIMLTHHEDITVTSKLGEGTRFSFTLPLASKYNLVEKK